MIQDKVREYRAELLGLEVPEEVQPASELTKVKQPESTARKVIKTVAIVLCVLGALPIIGFLLFFLFCAIVSIVGAIS